MATEETKQEDELFESDGTIDMTDDLFDSDDTQTEVQKPIEDEKQKGSIEPKESKANSKTENSKPQEETSDEEDLTEFAVELLKGADFDIDNDSIELIKSKTKGKGVDGLKDVVKEAIKSAQESVFASEDIKKLNQFVEKGGDIKQYLEVLSTKVIHEDMDLSNRDNAIKVVEEAYRMEGMTDKAIKKIIDKLDEEELENEAVLNFQAVLKNQEKKQKELELQVEKQRQEQIENQKRYVENINKQIDEVNLDLIELKPAERKALKSYIWDVDPKTKMSKYQKDLNELSQRGINPELIQAILVFKKAFNGGAIAKQLESKAKTSIAKKLNSFVSSKVGSQRQQSNNDYDIDNVL